MRWLFPFFVLLPATIPALANAVDFEKSIEPIFQERCIECHGREKQKGQLRLDKRWGLLKGGNSGEAAVIPGNAADSFLIKLVSHNEPDLEMPPKGTPLSPDEIERIKKWIDDGAKTPERLGGDVEKIELTHWSFIPPKREKSNQTIDDFVRKKLTAANLALSKKADRRTLIRRLYLVMHGLPPSPDEVEDFTRDERPDAWERLIDDVLASPRYGERWATHWLDIARYGDTNGFETNRERPNAWPFRDWVIESFNSDKPYDQFVRQQIAGDATGADIGTGFLVAGPFDTVKGQDPKLRQTQRMNELDDMINTTGTAFLGLTLGCARCHNHKFDPVTQADYYSMQAVFAGVQHAERALPLPVLTKEKIAVFEKDMNKLLTKLKPYETPVDPNSKPPVNFKENIESFEPVLTKVVRFTIEKSNGAPACIDEIEVFDSKNKNVALASRGAKATSNGDFVHPLHKLEQINDGKFGNANSWISGKNSDGWVQIELAEPTKIHSIKWGRDRLGKYKDRLAIGYRIEASATSDGDLKSISSSATRKPFSGKKADEPVYDFTRLGPEKTTFGKELKKRFDNAAAEIKTLSASTKIYAGSFNQPGPTHRLYRGEPDAKREEVSPNAIAVFTTLDLEKSDPEQKRRVLLANWIASPDNPLTARVIANRIWQFHFGAAIVDTPSDFGKNGNLPSHPELLDWLALELVGDGWSLKKLHRKILLSETWQQDSRPDETAIGVDATSRFLWRFPPRRLEAEGIRDSILAVTGSLDLKKSGGPGFSPFEVEMENVRHYHPKKVYGPEDWRRMIYMQKVRQERDSVFGVFDCPDASQAVPKRSRSTTPLQALNLLNSSFVMQQADVFAKSLKAEHESIKSQVEAAYQRCFGRSASASDIESASEFIEAEGLTQFARAMLNANEFVFLQ